VLNCQKITFAKVYIMLFEITLLIVTHLVVPAVFLISLWRSKFPSKLNWSIALLTLTAYSIHIFLIGRWDWISYYVRFLLPILFFIVAFQSFIKAKSLPLYPPKKFRNYLDLGINALIVIIFLASLKSYIPQGYFFSGKSVDLSFPLKNGTYYVAHGGDSPAINYHNPNRAQRYALDIMQLNALGARANWLYPRSLTDYAIFGETLYSPCDGTISSLVKDLPNLVPGEKDQKNPAGNHILLSCKGADILMAHLLKGSITSQVGSLVRSGDAIAKIGNSGNTSEPHLHIEAQKANTGKSSLDGEGIPITFDGKFLVRNSVLFKNESI
jgi:Peptidase family M23